MQRRHVASLLIVDELALFREGIAALCELSGRFEPCLTARNGEEAWALLQAQTPAAVLLDQQISGLDALEIARRLAANEGPRCVLMGFRTDRKCVLETLRAGAQGYLLKTSSARQLLDCLGQVLEGGIYVSPELNVQSLFSPQRPDAMMDPLSLLSGREYQVFSLLVEGVRAKEIASRLQVAPQTVDSHRVNLMKKLGIFDIPGLVRFALHHRLIEM